MLALAVFGPGVAASCADNETPEPGAEASTEDGVDAELVPGDAGNGMNTDPGDQAPGAQIGGDGKDEEDSISEDK